MRPTTVAPLALAAMMVAVGVMAVVTPASAAGAAYLSDTEYLAAARCAGIAQGLGADASPYAKVLDDQDAGRQGFVASLAASRREDATREARNAGPDSRGHLAAELGGVCHAIAG